MARDGIKLRSNYIQHDLPRWIACCDNCLSAWAASFLVMARSVYNGGFIPPTLKECWFRTPSQFYSMRDLRLPQLCCCCCCCSSTGLFFFCAASAVVAPHPRFWCCCCCFWCCCCCCCCCCSTALLLLFFVVLLLLLFCLIGSSGTSRRDFGSRPFEGT